MEQVSLTIDKGPHVFGREGEDPITTQTPVVTQVAVHGAEPAEFRGYQPIGEVGQIEIDLPSEMAERFGTFFLHCYADIAPEAGDWDCHSFVAHMLGEDVIGTTEALTPAQLDPQPTNPENVEPYAAYGLVKWDGNRGDNIHLVIVLPDGQNLSVRGIKSPVVIGSHQQMLDEFGAQTMHRIITPPRYQPPAP